MTEERLTELNERSKDDHAFIAGSEVRELIMALRAERAKVARVRELLANPFYDDIPARRLRDALDGEEKK
jgi:hypothetical protein